MFDPDDRAAALVYGDSLSARGDPRGELIALQIALEQNASPALKLREATLIAKHDVEWLGPLARHAPDVVVSWRRGFVDKLVIDHDLVGAGGEIGALLTEFFAAPAGAALRTLESHGGEHARYTGIPEAIAGARPPLLRTLIAHLSWPHHIDLHGFAHELGDLGLLWPALPSLEKLVLEGGGHGTTLGTIVAPRLRHFEVHTPYGLEPPSITSLAEATWPELETLIVRRCDERDQRLLERLLSGEGLPRLKHLGLPEGTFTEAFCEQLVRSPMLAQLATLEFAVWNLSVVGARALVENDAAFRHLERVHVRHNSIEREAQALLAGSRFAVFRNR